jgi:hypothetical protein
MQNIRKGILTTIVEGFKIIMSDLWIKWTVYFRKLQSKINAERHRKSKLQTNNC